MNFALALRRTIITSMPSAASRSRQMVAEGRGVAGGFIES